MKKIIVVALMLGCAPLFSQEKGFIEQNYIEVSGRAEKELSPDEIYLDIIITEKDNRGKVSIERQEQSFFKRLTSIGIDLSKDLQISDISSSLEKFFLRKNTILLTKSYVLKVNGTAQLTALFEQLEKEGITDVKITRTALSNFDEVSREIMADAALNAKKSAEAIAVALGRTLGKALYVQSYASFPRSYRVNTVMKMMDTSVESAGADFLPDFQKIKMEHQVVVRFALE
ncbi:MAG: SIMPL domain-containing protein [Bacteroidetes bacterium HGW-Bacteroidetes-7]|jgi:hypothetical protein|nr:MAG: SIMPL domain-containing protein [Bacteroidetes bacterium HGW-Bacteroidetes-7]